MTSRARRAGAGEGERPRPRQARAERRRGGGRTATGAASGAPRGGPGQGSTVGVRPKVAGGKRLVGIRALAPDDVRGKASCPNSSVAKNGRSSRSCSPGVSCVGSWGRTHAQPQEVGTRPAACRPRGRRAEACPLGHTSTCLCP